MSTKLGQARLSRSGGWVGGWVRNTGNKAQLRPAGAGALPELGKNGKKIMTSIVATNVVAS